MKIRRTLILPLLALAACGESETPKTEEGRGAVVPSSDAAYLELAQRQALETPRLRLDPTPLVVDLATARSGIVELVHAEGPAVTPEITIVPQDGVSLGTDGCPSTLEAGEACKIEVRAAPDAKPASYALIVKTPTTAVTADVRFVGAAPVAPVEVVAAPDPDEDLRAALEAEAASVDPYLANLQDAAAGAAPQPWEYRPGLEPFSPPPESARVIASTTRIALTAEHDILTSGTGVWNGVVQFPVYGPARSTSRGVVHDVLIPQGSKVVGYYSAEGAQQGRVDLVVTRIEDPQRRRLDIAPLSLRDVQGRARIPAAIDKRLVAQGLATLATTALAVAPLLLSDGSTTTLQGLDGAVTEQSDASRAAEIASERLREYGDTVVRETIDTARRAAISAGETMILQPAEDWFVPAAGDPAAATFWLSRQQRQIDQPGVLR